MQSRLPASDLASPVTASVFINRSPSGPECPPTSDPANEAAGIQEPVRVEFALDSAHDLQRRCLVAPDVQPVFDRRAGSFDDSVSTGRDTVLAQILEFASQLRRLGAC